MEKTFTLYEQVLAYCTTYTHANYLHTKEQEATCSLLSASLSVVFRHLKNSSLLVLSPLRSFIKLISDIHQSLKRRLKLNAENRNGNKGPLIFLPLFITLIFSSQLFAQTGGANTFFPYAVGNRWEYKSRGGSVSGYTIIRDSISDDGGRILFTSGYVSAFPRFKVKSDSTVIEYALNGYPELLYKLNYKAGEQWIVDSSSSFKRVAKVERVYLYPYFDSTRTHARIAYYQLGPNDTIDPGQTALYRGIMVVGFGKVEEIEGELGTTQIYLNGCIINGRWFGILSDIDEKIRENKTEQLFSNYPNPFSNNTTVRYTLPWEEFVTIQVYNTLGELVTSLTQGYKPAGEHKVTINLPDKAKGVYLCRLKAGKDIKTIKMLSTGTDVK